MRHPGAGAARTPPALPATTPRAHGAAAAPGGGPGDAGNVPAWVHRMKEMQSARTAHAEGADGSTADGPTADGVDRGTEASAPPAPSKTVPAGTPRTRSYYK